MKIFLVTFAATLTGCAGLMKNDSYHLERPSPSSFRTKCDRPGKEGDLVRINANSFYFDPIRKFTMFGPPFLPIFPINFGFRKDELRLMFAVDLAPDTNRWKIRLNGSGDWLTGTLGQSRLGSFISFKISDLPDDIELQFLGDDSRPITSAHFKRHSDWIYRPIIGLEGEQLTGWMPGCAR